MIFVLRILHSHNLQPEENMDSVSASEPSSTGNSFNWDRQSAPQFHVKEKHPPLVYSISQGNSVERVEDPVKTNRVCSRESHSVNGDHIEHDYNDEDDDGKMTLEDKKDLVFASYSVKLKRKRISGHEDEEYGDKSKCSDLVYLDEDLNFEVESEEDENLDNSLDDDDDNNNAVRLPFPCDNCDRSYSHKVSLTKHQKQKHRPEDLETTPPSDDTSIFKCDLCPKTYHRMDSLKRHKKIVHMARKGPSERFSKHPKKDTRLGTLTQNKEEYPCDRCDKKYQSKGALALHEKKKHSGESLDSPGLRTSRLTVPFSTSDYPAKVKAKIKSKIKANTSGAYTCDVCGKTVLYQRSLERHMKNVHPNACGLLGDGLEIREDQEPIEDEEQIGERSNNDVLNSSLVNVNHDESENQNDQDSIVPEGQNLNETQSLGFKKKKKKRDKKRKKSHRRSKHSDKPSESPESKEQQLEEEELAIPDKKTRTNKKLKRTNEFACPHCPKTMMHSRSVDRHIKQKHSEQSVKIVLQGEVQSEKINEDHLPQVSPESSSLMGNLLDHTRASLISSSDAQAVLNDDGKVADLSIETVSFHDTMNNSSENVGVDESLKGEATKNTSRFILIQLSHMEKFMSDMIMQAEASGVAHSTVLDDVKREFGRLSDMIWELQVQKGMEEVVEEWAERKSMIWSQILAYQTRSHYAILERKRRYIMSLIELCMPEDRQEILDKIHDFQLQIERIQDEVMLARWMAILFDIKKLHHWFCENQRDDEPVESIFAPKRADLKRTFVQVFETQLHNITSIEPHVRSGNNFPEMDQFIDMIRLAYRYLKTSKLSIQTGEQMELMRSAMLKLPDNVQLKFEEACSVNGWCVASSPLRTLCCFCVSLKANWRNQTIS